MAGEVDAAMDKGTSLIKSGFNQLGVGSMDNFKRNLLWGTALSLTGIAAVASGAAVPVMASSAANIGIGAGAEAATTGFWAAAGGTAQGYAGGVVDGASFLFNEGKDIYDQADWGQAVDALHANSPT